MKKKVIGILVCIMLMAVIPTAAGMNCDTKTKAIANDGPDSETEGLLKDKIILRGIVFNPHTTIGGKFAFIGVRVHYTAIGVQGIRRGILNMQRITLPDTPNGLITNGYMIVSFKGDIESII